MNPSLLLIPDRYKAAKLYSQIPDSGAGDLTFARNSNATRVNSAGLIEKVRTNLLTYSQLFSNAAWTKVGLTLTGSQTDPNGGTTAFLATATATSSSYFYQSTTTAGCVSIFAKAGTRSKFCIINGLFAQGAEFDLATQTTIVSGAGSLAKIESVGGGWFRCSVFLSSITEAIIALDEVFGGGVTVGQTMSFAFAQHETGDIATDYIPTTTAAVSVGITADIPRLDYTGGGCPSLLLEPQRTNLINFSEQLNNAYWTPNGATISANSTIAPDGTISMDRLTETATSGNHSVGSTAVTIFSNQVRTNSVFVKKGNVRYIQLISNAFSDSSCSAIFDLDTKTVTDFRAQSAAGPIFVYVNSGVEDYGNGILRLFLTNTSTFDNTTFHINHSNVATFAAGTLTDGFITYSGSASSFTDLWGAQVEIGSYATSYIPTLGSSVTRLADAASKTGISSFLSASEYTLFWDGTHIPTGQFNSFMTISQTSNANNSARFYRNNTDNQIRAAIFNSVNGLVIDIGSGITTQTAKCALRVKAGSYAFYVNGTLVGSSANALTPSATLDQIDLQYLDSTQSFDQKTDQVLFFKTGLTNAELQSLTSL
jgi:hypothetical protein